MIKNIKNFRSRLIWRLDRKGYFNKLSDETVIKLLYWAAMHKLPNLKNPETYNEKIQWLKLNDRNPLYTIMVDKYKVKDYVASIIGNEYVVPLYGVYDNFDAIDFNNLPSSFVLKTNHAGGVYICVDKDKMTFFDKSHKRITIDEVKTSINNDLQTDYYLSGRSWQYKNVERKIIAEKMLDIKEDANIPDYKFFCFDGKVKFYYVVNNNQDGLNCTFFDRNHQKIDVWQHDHSLEQSEIKIPKNIDAMISLSEQLSCDIPHVRVDWYEVEGKLYFGEFTFHNWAGFCPFNPPEYDKIFGSYIDLSKAYCYKQK